MQYIYARTSTKGQNVEQQVIYLQSRYKADEVFKDQTTGKSLDRPSFIKLRSTVVAGDSVIVQDLSRIGRNTTEVLEFVEEMSTKQVGIQIDDLGKVDITSAAGKMVLTTLAAVATMQREQMLEKQSIGIATARANGKFKGKQQTQATIDKCQHAQRLLAKGITKEEAAKAAGVGVATLYRYIKQA